MTAVAEFRFYKDLNDFLPRERRKHAFRYQCARRATVKQTIEAIGVPHTEIEFIFVNGASVDISHLVSDGDRVSVCPQFESLDITPLLRVRERPLRTPRFIADAHLAELPPPAHVRTDRRAECRRDLKCDSRHSLLS